jgi:branched-chain amino acid transport system permease protein
VACGFFFINRVISSPFGQILKAIKENEPRAISLGYMVDRFKFLAFVLSAALAGLAGSVQAIIFGFETLSDVHWTMSGLVILMTLVGGVGTMLGPFVGALVIVLLEHKVGEIGAYLTQLTGIAWFNSLGESVTIVTGLIFIICVMAFRRGLVGVFTKKN